MFWLMEIHRRNIMLIYAENVSSAEQYFKAVAVR